MSQTYLLAELDRDTREYLLEVRDRKGKKMPGVYAPVANALPTLGCICGPILVIATLLFTLTDWINVVYDDPNRVALLQTAGLLLGGWMFVAALRVWAGARSSGNAGRWVYADALHVYEATGERVVVTPVEEVRGVDYSHKYNNDTYQNTVVTLRLARKVRRTITVAGEAPAERFVGFLNYLLFAYGPDGDDRDELPAEQLGALAKHVAKTDDEPLDEHGKPNLKLVGLDWDGTVPEEPERVRRAPPHVLPYIVLLLAAPVCYFVMRAVDVPVRDDAIYDAYARDPVEPRYLRAYLIDPRNTRHREQVTKLLTTFYDPVVAALNTRAGGSELKGGLAKVLESVRTAEQAVVSLRVTEAKPPVGGAGGSDARVKRLRDAFASQTAQALTPMTRQINIPPGVIITPPPPPVGEQLLAFLEAPSDAPNAHFDVRYWYQANDDGGFKLTCRVEIRVNVDDPPVASSEFALPKNYATGQEEAAVADLVTRIVADMTGGQQPVAPPMPGFPPPGVPGFVVPGP